MTYLTELLTRRAAWTEQAACLLVDPDTMYADAGGGHFNAAREVCLSCLVREECLAEALDYERRRGVTGRWGMWGGLTPEERQRLDRRRR